MPKQRKSHVNIRTPLPLYHSWPLFEAAERLDVPLLRPFVLGAMPSPLAIASIDDVLAARGIGVWECDLADNRLLWSQGVYDLFGLPRDMAVDRDFTVSLYREGSRAVMEQLRSHAIRHRRGFTVDVEIRQPGGEERWMRLSALPVLEGRKVVRLCGLKIDVTGEYDGGVERSMAA